MVLVLALLFFCIGLWFIVKGGDFLVRSALALCEVTGIKQIVIGATFVSVATTLPEVFVSIFAVMANNHGIAVGNAVGSMIANVALVFALYIIFLPGCVRRNDLVNKSIFLGLVVIIVMLFCANLWLSWYEGVLLLFGFALFLYFNVREAKAREPHIPMCPPDGLPIIEPCLTREQKRKAILKITGGFIIGQIMLIIGAFTIVQYGEELAHILSISETVVGFTLIAIGTSLPELITCISSIQRRSGGLALGNVLGANIINCTLLLGTCGVIGDIKGYALPISRDTLFISLPVLLLFSLIAVLPMLIKGRTYRWQGVLLLTLYAVYIGYLMLVQPV